MHEKRRRLANLKFRLAVLEADLAAGRVRLTSRPQYIEQR